ncbi:hypothetical protein TYRP_017012 [Tyrophagus putrescentiae]|nr:hypothetical protein TYRP_017012 [Tyrophagus putrescentiae]
MSANKSPHPLLTILVMTVDCIGHLNACIGTTRPLLDRGHRVIFLLSAQSRGQLLKQGFEEFIVEDEEEDTTTTTKIESGQSYTDDLVTLGIMGPRSSLSLEEKYVKVVELFTTGALAQEARRKSNEVAKKAIEALQPDLIAIDGHLPPAVYFSGIPWVNIVSVTALCHLSNEAEELPPSSSGMSSNSKDQQSEAWNRFKRLNLLYRFSSEVNDLHETMGYPRFPSDRLLPYEDALLTVYAHSVEYNWPAIQAKKEWFNLEVFNKNEQRVTIPLEQLLPREFIEDHLNDRWSGRLMGAISRSRHKFIVSKGPRHKEFSLPENAWGDRFLPQAELLPLVDLVITHAGNNTVTETFAQGVPMLLLPLFGDQMDNAQRLHETGYGRRLDPYDFTADQLLSTIDQLLEDELLKAKLKVASKRLLSNGRHQELALEIERRWTDLQEMLKVSLSKLGVESCGGSSSKEVPSQSNINCNAGSEAEMNFFKALLPYYTLLHTVIPLLKDGVDDDDDQHRHLTNDNVEAEQTPVQVDFVRMIATVTVLFNLLWLPFSLVTTVCYFFSDLCYAPGWLRAIMTVLAESTFLSSPSSICWSMTAFD